MSTLLTFIYVTVAYLLRLTIRVFLCNKYNISLTWIYFIFNTLKFLLLINILAVGWKQFTFYNFPLTGSGHSGPYPPSHSNQGLGCIADGGLYQPGEVFYNIAGDRCTCTLTGRATCISNSHKLPCKYDNFNCDTVLFFVEHIREKEKCLKICNWWNISINMVTCKIF